MSSTASETDGQALQRIGGTPIDELTKTDLATLQRIAGVSEFGYFIPYGQNEFQYMFGLAFDKFLSRVAARLGSDAKT